MRDDDDIPLSPQEDEEAARGQALIAAAVADTRAPQSLRERIEDDRRRAASPPLPFWRRRGRAVGAGLAAALAVAVIAVVALVPGGGSGSGSPSLAQVDAVAGARPTAPAPASVGGQPPVLDAKVGALTFPDWEKKFDWRATGTRSDQLEGRTVKTVFYRNPAGADLGYAVVDGAALSGWERGRVVTRDGKTYRVDDSGDRTVVTWTQQGQTCVISGASTVPAARLVDLAASRNS
jgi:hypothetical protein